MPKLEAQIFVIFSKISRKGKHIELLLQYPYPRFYSAETGPIRQLVLILNTFLYRNLSGETSNFFCKTCPPPLYDLPYAKAGGLDFRDFLNISRKGKHTKLLLQYRHPFFYSAENGPIRGLIRFSRKEKRIDFFLQYRYPPFYALESAPISRIICFS